QLLFGMTIVAGLTETLLGAGLRRLRVVFPPLVCGFIVAAVGFDLGVIGIAQVLDVRGGVRGPDFHAHVAAAILTPACIIGFSVWGKGMLRLLCSLLGILSGFAVAAAFGLVQPEAVAQLVEAPVFAIPTPAFTGYRLDAAVLVPFLLAGLAAGLRTVG